MTQKALGIILIVIAAATLCTACVTAAAVQSCSAVRRICFASSACIRRDFLLSAPQRCEVARKFARDFGMLETVGDIRLQITELAAAIVAHAGELMREHALFSKQSGDTVGQLNFAAGAGLYLVQELENPRR